MKQVIHLWRSGTVLGLLWVLVSQSVIAAETAGRDGNGRVFAPAVSAVGEPLEVRIPLSLTDAQTQRPEVRIAGNSGFSQLGVPRYSVHDDLSVALESSTSTEAEVVITSPDPFYEPFLQLVLELEEAGAPRPVLVEVSLALQDPDGQSRRIIWSQADDTLWRIATRTRDSADVTMSQQMLGIQSLNPDAFAEDNINGLRADVRLSLPRVREVVWQDVDQALRDVETQHRRWAQFMSSGARGITADVTGAVRIYAEEEEVPAPEPAVQPAPLAEEADAQGLADTVGQSQDANLMLVPEGEGTTSPVEPLAETTTEAPEAADADTETLEAQAVDQAAEDEFDLDRLEAELASENALLDFSALSEALSPEVVAMVAALVLLLGVVILRARRNADDKNKKVDDAWRGGISSPSEKEIEPSVGPQSPPEEAPESAEPEGEPSDEADFLNTRLRLAEAYLEMADVAGAREMLEDVIEQGDEAQRAQAQALLERIESQGNGA